MQLLGWVPTALCRKYSQGMGDALLAAMPLEALRGDPPGGPGPAPGSEAHLNRLCLKALKLASQYSRRGDLQLVGGLLPP